MPLAPVAARQRLLSGDPQAVAPPAELPAMEALAGEGPLAGAGAATPSAQAASSAHTTDVLLPTRHQRNRHRAVGLATVFEAETPVPDGPQPAQPPQPVQPPDPLRPSLLPQPAFLPFARGRTRAPRPARPALTFSELEAIVRTLQQTVRGHLLQALPAPESWVRGARVDGIVALRRALERACVHLREPQGMRALLRSLDAILVQAMTLWPRGRPLLAHHQRLAAKGLHHVVLAFADETDGYEAVQQVASSFFDVDFPRDYTPPPSPVRSVLACPLAVLGAKLAEEVPDELAHALNEAHLAMAGASAQVLRRLRALVDDGSSKVLRVAMTELAPMAETAAAPLLRRLPALVCRLRREADEVQAWLRQRVEVVAERRHLSLRLVAAADEAGRLPTTLPCPIFDRRELPIASPFDRDRILLAQLAVLDATEALLVEAEATAKQIRLHGERLRGSGVLGP